MPHETRKQRQHTDGCIRAHEALVVYRARRPSRIEASHVIDILADLRHLCAQDGVNFALCNELAAAHYNEETKP